MKRKIKIIINDTLEEEKALMIDGKLILKGDYYHDHIDELINGFVRGIKFCGEACVSETVFVSPDDDLFKELKFYNDN